MIRSGFGVVMRLGIVVACFATTGCLLGRTGIGLDDEDGGLFDDTGDSGIIIVDGDPSEGGLEDGGVSDSSTAPPDTAGRDTFIDIWDVIPFPIPDSGPIGACASCVRDNCGNQVNQCINSPACRQGLACTVQKCLGGSGPGGFDLQCVLGCFNGDFSQAMSAIQTFTCVLGKCGTQCGGLLGGLGGGLPGGGGGGGGGGMPGGAQFQSRLQSLSSFDPDVRVKFSPEAFAPWAKELRESACIHGYAICK